MKPFHLTNFSIKKLFGTMDLSIPIEDNRVVVTGVNGTGKTTILNIFFYMLRGRWEELVKYDFEEISLTINGKAYCYQFSELEEYVSKVDNDIKIVQKRLVSAKKKKQFLYQLLFGLEDGKTLRTLQKEFENDIDIAEAILQIRNRYQHKKPLTHEDRDKIKNILNPNHTVRFYPTFRRIEKDLREVLEFSLSGTKILPDIKVKEVGHINLGMEDIDELFEAILKEIKVLKLFFTENRTKDRLELDEIVKPKFAIITEDEVDYAIRTLKNAQSNLADFIKICNSYLSYTNKEIILDETHHKLKIFTKHKQEIDLKALSSGEKQIISVFANLYLSNKNDFIIIIDEPELSLSVEWQRTFLSDTMATGKCGFLIAVTHSPFIFENDLDPYAKDMQDLCVEV